MTDRIKGLIVTLEQDLRADDAEELIKSIRLLRGIAAVRPSVAQVEDYLNRERVKHELRQQLRGILE